MSFKLEFETGNSAFADDPENEEVARILRGVADRVYEGRRDTWSSALAGIVRDSNGNTVGRWELTAD